jgi:TolA-binding protein
MLGRLLGFTFILLCSIALAQPNEEVYNNHPSFKRALDLFEKEKYAAAQELFAEAQEGITNKQDEFYIFSEYYQAICALTLFHNDSEERLNNFLRDYPDSKWSNEIHYQLGNLYYRKKKYQKTILEFEKVSSSTLKESDKTAFHFKKGYSYLQIDDKRRALLEFTKIKDRVGDYFNPSNYYYAHLNYENGNYTEALESFKRVQNDKNFRNVIPYYVVQIYHLQGKPDELLAYAIPMMKTAAPEKTGEISRLIGEAYYNKKEYEKAQPYLVQFATEGLPRTTDDNYQLGNCYYQNGDYDNAIKYLNYASNDRSIRSQTALYQMADCYINIDKLTAARDAFNKAYQIDLDPKITEDALFNYAKLAYELSYNPYNEAIEAFETYLNKYPNSIRTAEANEFLTFVYLTTKNYNAALISLSKIKNKDFQLQSAYQYVAYNRGVELMLSKDYQGALQTFKKVSTFPIEKKLIALSYFWQGEILYNLSSYKRSIAAFTQYLNSPSSYSTSQFYLAQYNLGYAYFKLEMYEPSISAFRKYVATPGKDAAHVSDALVRIADGYFVKKDYDKAIDFYQQAYLKKDQEGPYALYQNGISNGYNNNDEQKITILSRFVDEYSTDDLYPSALYELGDAYFKTGNNEAALQRFEAISNAYGESPLAKKALLQTGLILYRNQQYQDALASFKEIVNRYPNFEDSKEAIARAEDIYVELGRVDDYNTWISGLDFYDLTQGALDSINFRAAENAFSKEDCEKSVELFTSYLSKFESPIFELNAHSYTAECYFKMGNTDSALVHYNAIANAPVNKFSETALVTAAYLNYQDSNYTLALDQYIKLNGVATFKLNKIESQLGQMRCYRELGNHRFAIDYSNRLAFYSTVPTEILVEALQTKANSFMSLRDTAQAYLTFKELHDGYKSIEGAEALYNMAIIQYSKGNYTKAEDLVFEMVNSTPIYDDWLARSFILLGDVYVKTDNLFQAKATLKSVIDNHDGDELKQQAQAKYDAILALENTENEGVVDTLEINFEVDTKNENLFEEPTIEAVDSLINTVPATTIIDSTSTPKQ